MFLYDVYDRALKYALNDPPARENANGMTNCPNCGAPIVSAQCEYCGTVFSKPRTSYVSEDVEYLKAKNKVLESELAMHALYRHALEAMRKYSD